jgi:hypothetical protein
MVPADSYVDMKGTNYVLAVLDDEERKLVDELKLFAGRHPDWGTFSTFYIGKIGSFYESRGLSRREITKSSVWKIAQDLAGRIHVAQGIARPSDYRDELEFLIHTNFSTRRAFCEATGLSEDMLSHVLAGRKHLGIETLTDALAKIGYTIHITPMPDVSPPSQLT